MTQARRDGSAHASTPIVGLFVTCLVDVFRPSIGFAAVKLLEDAGCKVEAPSSQTCCGQPAYNSGDRANTRAIALGVIDAFETFDYVVAPSGSCSAMLKEHYPALFTEEPVLKMRAEALAAKTYELLSFLVDVLHVESVAAHFDGVATYHDSCSGLRELGIKQQPRKLLASVTGLTLNEMTDCEVCCGFGGTFCVKYPDISNRMVTDKAAHIERSGADTVMAGDLGCLLNIAGKLKRNNSAIRVRHIAEILAGFGNAPAIGESR